MGFGIQRKCNDFVSFDNYAFGRVVNDIFTLSSHVHRKTENNKAR